MSELTGDPRRQDCTEVREALVDEVSAPLTGGRARRIERHLASCRSCAEAREVLQRSWRALPEAPAVVPSDVVRRRVLLHAAHASRTGGEARARPEVPGRYRRHRIAAALVLAAATGVGTTWLVSRGQGRVEEPTTSVSALPTSVGPRAELRPGDPLPAFTARDVFTGEPVSVDQFRGRVVLLNIWATWCLPCESEMPSMERLYRDLGAEGLTVVALSIDRESTHLVRRWVEERGLTFTVLHDPEGTFERSYASSGVPESYVFDRSGRLVSHEIGPRVWDAPDESARLARLVSDGL